jgi:hypothetical protein
MLTRRRWRWRPSDWPPEVPAQPARCVGSCRNPSPCKLRVQHLPELAAGEGEAPFWPRRPIAAKWPSQKVTQTASNQLWGREETLLGWDGDPPQPWPGGGGSENHRGLLGVSSSAATGGIGSRPSDTLRDASSSAPKHSLHGLVDSPVATTGVDFDDVDALGCSPLGVLSGAEGDALADLLVVPLPLLSVLRRCCFVLWHAP